MTPHRRPAPRWFVQALVYAALTSSIISSLGMLLVPFVHLSVYLFRTLHPQPVVLKPSAPSLPPAMLRTLLLSVLVFTVLYIGLVTVRYGIALAGQNDCAAGAGTSCAGTSKASGSQEPSRRKAHSAPATPI